MWISKLELTSFKSYQHQSFSFPSPAEGGNVVLIGGMNGYGKTSILEALYLCLYGKDAIAHLARAGLKTDEAKGGYPTFLERAFNGEAKREGRDTMSVRVVINKTKTKAVDIARKWYFRPNGNWTYDEEAIVREIVRDIPDAPRMDGKNGFYLSELLDEEFVPAHVAPFFFFDGEEVKKLADQSRVEQVKQGLEGLLGVVLLRNLADRLKNFESLRRGDVSSVDEENMSRLLDTLSDNQSQLKNLKRDAEESEEQLSVFREERHSLIERITSAGGGGGDIATVKDLVEEREQLRNKVKECQRRLEDILSGRLPFHLMAKDLLELFREQLEAEIKLFQHESEKQALEPRQAEFESAFSSQTSPEFDPPLTSEQLLVIKKRIETAWASLFFPPPDDCAKSVIHDYMHGPMRQKALDFLGNLSLGQKEIQDILNEQNNLTQRVDELGRKISKLEGIDRDGTLTALKQQLEKAQNGIVELEDRIRADDRKVVALESIVTQQKADYERQKRALDESSPVRSLIKKSERVRAVIDDVIPALFPLKVKELAHAMTTVYKQLAHKNLVSKIEIHDDGTTQILGKNGKEIPFDRSAGENQIFATALIAGLAKVSGVKAPMVVDTPLGRLDSKHRQNILTFWTNESNRQVILLSQDKEIDHTFFQQIKEHVGKTYLLEHVDVGDGIGRTTAQEDAYFAREKK
jgi:DNA sulfur modification protein DndD